MGAFFTLAVHQQVIAIWRKPGRKFRSIKWFMRNAIYPATLIAIKMDVMSTVRFILMRGHGITNLPTIKGNTMYYILIQEITECTVNRCAIVIISQFITDLRFGKS